MNDLRNAVSAIGWLPIALGIAGFFLPGRLGKIAMVVGGFWAISNLLRSHARVDVGDGVSITTTTGASAPYYGPDVDPRTGVYTGGGL